MGTGDCVPAAVRGALGSLRGVFCGVLFQNATVFGGDGVGSVAMKGIGGVVLRYTTGVADCNT